MAVRPLIDGEQVTLRCVDLDDEGAGLGDHDGAHIHVAGALPGEEVSATVTHVSSHRAEAWARLDRIEHLSPDRRAPACAAFGSCGGCVLQHLDVTAQLAWKSARVARAMAAHPDLAGTVVSASVPSPRSLGYRNRSKLVCAADRGRVVLGAFAPRSHDVVDLAGCRIAEAPLEEVASALRVLLGGAEIAPYDERTLTGDLRHVVLRANHAGHVLAILVTARQQVPGLAGLAGQLRAERPEVAGVVQNVNPTRGNVIFGPEERALDGALTLEERVGSVALQLSPRAFFQANREVAALAYAAIAREVAVRPGDRVVDAYGGVGGIALTLAPGAGEVIGIEEHAGATADAIAAAALNGVTNARFVTGDVAVRLREIDRADVVVVNPPRKGCSAAALEQVQRLGPRVIAYLSCDPDTLARDLAWLAAHHHGVRSVTPFDMLPHTAHVEALAILDRL
jgi:23S rRNA (uracil1939-C5)-methyltransferase